MPYDSTTETTIREDFRRLWNTNFLDNLWIEVNDYTFSNGVIGKMVTYNMEERQRVKIVDYVGSKKLETTKIDEKLKEANTQIRLDTFIDPGLVQKVETIVRDMMKEKGFQNAEVTHEIKEMPGGPKLVHLTFHIDEGPKVKIKKITFIGNKAIGSGTLQKQMKENKPQWFWSFISGRGTYQETKFDDDAEKVLEYYRDHGYFKANVGAPEIKVLGDSDDKKTRYIELRVPITEGNRYKVGEFTFAGNTVVKTDALKPMFALKEGEYYSEKVVRKGLEKAREVYGAGGYFEFTGYPDLKVARRPQPGRARDARGAGGRAGQGPGHRARDCRHHDAHAGRPAVLRQPHYVCREQHDARQRHPPRDSAGRERRLQHRGAEIQRQAAESARLLQAARERARRQRREDGGRDQQGRRQAEARGTEPESAHLRRGRVGIRRLFRTAVVPDLELPGPRRELHALAAGGVARAELHARRSPSRSCSTATLPAGSTCRRTTIRYVGQFTQESRAERSPSGSRSPPSPTCTPTTATSG